MALIFLFEIPALSIRCDHGSRSVRNEKGIAGNRDRVGSHESDTDIRAIGTGINATANTAFDLAVGAA